MKQFHGTTAAEGLALGQVVVLEREVSFLNRVVQEPHRERELFNTAVLLAKQELQRLAERAGGDEKDIFLFQQMLLEDDTLVEEIGDYIAAGAGSAAAVERAAQLYARSLSDMDDDYISQRSADVRDACQRVVDILDGRPRGRLRLNEPAILAAEDFYPSDIVGMGRGMILGLAAAAGSPKSHAAILARSLDLPMVLGLGSEFLKQCGGKTAALDAESGRLILEPDAGSEHNFRRRMLQAEERRRAERRRAAEPCLTKDGTAVSLLAGVVDPDGVEAAVRAGARGIGLLRTEFLLFSGHIPSEDEQHASYLHCLSEARGRTITVRTFDLGAEQSPGQTAALAPCANPALGLRGLRCAAARPTLLQDQLCALLRVSVGGNLRIAFPMVTCAEDWDFCMRHLAAAKARLTARGTPFDPNVPVGCVIDTPAAALCAEELCLIGPAFVLISASDLTQYTYAADRIDVQVQPFYRPTGRAVTRLLRIALESAHRHGLSAGVCGITAGEPALAEWYLRAGAREMILPARMIPEVAAHLAAIDLRA